MKVFKCGCGHEYIEMAKCNKAYILLSQMTEKQIKALQDDASRFGGIDNCEVINVADYINEIVLADSIERADEAFNKFLNLLKTWDKIADHIEIYGNVPIILKFLIFEQAQKGKQVFINEPISHKAVVEQFIPTTILYI